jgi:hypothetical protein
MEPADRQEEGRWIQVGHWCDSVSLLSHALSVIKDNHLATHGKTGEAITHYMEATRLQPGYAASNHNLRLALQSLGRER